jgi:hypothetical protein
VITFIIRRLIVTVFLLLLVSLMTFAIFFLIPRLAGQTSYAARTGVSLPIFFTGLIALQLFTYQWPIFPDPQFVPLTENPLAWAWNLVLPWTTLAFLYAALYARLLHVSHTSSTSRLHTAGLSWDSREDGSAYSSRGSQAVPALALGPACHRWVEDDIGGGQRPAGVPHPRPAGTAPPRPATSAA